MNIFAVVGRGGFRPSGSLVDLPMARPDQWRTLCSTRRRAHKFDQPFDRLSSPAFLAPDIVQAAVKERLPRGCGFKRLIDLPMAWPGPMARARLHAPA